MGFFCLAEDPHKSQYGCRLKGPQEVARVAVCE